MNAVRFADMDFMLFIRPDEAEADATVKQNMKGKPCSEVDMLQNQP